MTTVVGKSWTKGKGAIPVRGPSVAVIGTGKGKTELAGGVKGMAEKSYGRCCKPARQRVWDQGARDTRRLG